VRTRRTVLAWILTAGAALLTAGCPKPPTPAAAGAAGGQTTEPHLGGAPHGKPQTQVRDLMDRMQAQNQLSQLGVFLQAYKGEQGRFPNNLQELVDYIKTDAKREYESLKTGYFIYVPTQNATSQTIVVYEYAPDLNNNRMVLMGDGSVHRIPEAEFKAAMPAANK
jgi:hypothetical protein